MSARDAAPAVIARAGVVPRIAAGAAYGAVVVAVAAVAAWPIYRSWHLLVLVAASVAVAAGIAAVAWRRRWSGWLVAGVVAIAFAVVGVPLAVPSRLGAPADILRGLADLLAGAVLGFKDLVTVELPVGSYRNLLVPALVVFLVGTCALLLLSWRADRAAYAAVPVGLAMMWFGLFFGRAAVSAPLVAGPLVLHAPVETALGVAGLLASLLWLAWRTHDERVRALQRAAASSGVRISRRPSAADRRRTALGAGMVAGALVIAIVIVPYAARGVDRQVLRSAVGPQIDLSAEVSPLARYRALFADGRTEEVLFSVEADGALPERIRLATLDSYDGEVFRSGGDGAVDEGRFVRVPSTLDAGEGTAVRVRVEVGQLEGIWMPTVGRLAEVEFSGDRAAALADRFYYNAVTQAGVQTAGGGLETGDAYVVDAVEPGAPALAAVEAPGGVGSGVTAPESLRTWVDRHVSGTGGAALARLVELLRARGYLSHGLTLGDEPSRWMTRLADYSFQPSASGHSLARIDSAFTRLLEREGDPRAVSTDNYVAAVGDDEQFAVAVALMARELGFPSRVVVGARLGSADPGLATCEAGVCRAGDISAWTEVQSAGGEWVPIDVTPQYEVSPSLDVTEQRDPENVTEVRPESVEEVLPPDPVQEDSASGDIAPDAAGPDLAWLWPIVRAGGLAVLVLLMALGPFLIVIGAKASRRRRRRRRGAPAARIAGGWDEYVDAALDAGLEAPRSPTRRELAAAFATPSAESLADIADEAVFSGSSADPAAATAYWKAVDAERAHLLRSRGVWRRVVATVSLRSLFRQVPPVAGARVRFPERGRRRAAEPVRPTP